MPVYSNFFVNSFMLSADVPKIVPDPTDPTLIGAISNRVYIVSSICIYVILGSSGSFYFVSDSSSVKKYF